MSKTPWKTARRYADSPEPAERIARELNVDAVLEGTFELVGDRIVTTLTLVEAESGLVTWANEFEEPYEDLFRMQRRIATGAASSLKSELTGEEEEALETPESRSVDAYDFYLQGSHIMQEDTEEATNIAFEYFTLAVELDPNLAEAHVGLGAVYAQRYSFGWEGGLQNLDWAKASYERALDLNPASMTSRRGLVVVNYYSGTREACLIQGREAERYGRADDLETLLTRAFAYYLGGLPERSLPLYRRVLEIDPVNEEARFHLVAASFRAEQFQESIDIGSAYILSFGDVQTIHANVAASYQLLGNHEDARTLYEKVFEPGSLSFVPKFFLWACFFFEEMREREQAENAWRKGVTAIEPRLEAYPDNTRMRAYLACFYGLLGERGSFAREEQQAFGTADSTGAAAHHLAAVHARLGEMERATELLLSDLQLGRLRSHWRLMFDLASVDPVPSEAFDQFLEEYEAEERRLREIY